MSHIIDPTQFFDKMPGTISAKKQIRESFIDLTIAKLFRIKSGAKLDFGGGEFSGAKIEPISPIKESADETYGWWKLHEGQFLFQYNESIPLVKNQIILIQPHTRLLQSGCFHPTLTVNKINVDFRMLLWVNKMGIQIKENARISQTLILKF
jgi:hypothetical protein